ncbi:M23 family metallopeptidase [Oceanithermus desulfurans]|uniref:Peptidase M23 n=2 Tax=Oceanithermus desulfurans TaxID=227924 RepID=A0A511RMB6_9DEIN|nr:M23 family metallopeptidase [Oceanithermus desulfurans]MBB6030507.1 murein DD-endopeptidase MepM/ murein hydrolase activator NlpD [Oceanithermus desulfurans]GEM90082.1 peptidase M23 [Oceanithermus desulfurans NBRC 100063]
MKTGLKPGWYVLIALVLYALVVTLAWRHDRAELHRLRAALAGAPVPEASGGGPERYLLPLPGACLPEKPEHLPGYPRDYRKGANQGFIFASGDACVPVVYGTGVVAAQRGRVLKAEQEFQELSAAEFDALIEAVAGGATPEQMDRLRGREVWIEHPDGRITVYAHLSGLRPDLAVGQLVERGEWIGYVGNSGTQAASRGSREGARLLLEVWRGNVDTGTYLGQGLDPRENKDKLLTLARALFAVP